MITQTCPLCDRTVSIINNDDGVLTVKCNGCLAQKITETTSKKEAYSEWDKKVDGYRKTGEWIL